MLAGENVHLLIQQGGGRDDVEIRAFARHEEAVEAFHEVLGEAVMFEEVEGPDDLAFYDRNRYFYTGNESAEVVTVEVE